MPITYNHAETHALVTKTLPYSVDICSGEPFFDALNWCCHNLGQQLAIYVSGGDKADGSELACYMVRHQARWAFWGEYLRFACAGDAAYVKLKWGGDVNRM